MPSVFLALGSLCLSAWAGGDAVKGELVFKANCVACHGENADGKGPAAVALRPPPRDLTDPEFWADQTDEKLESVIRSGKPATAMMGFAQLSADDMADLIAFLRTKKPSSP